MKGGAEPIRSRIRENCRCNTSSSGIAINHPNFQYHPTCSSHENQPSVIGIRSALTAATAPGSLASLPADPAMPPFPSHPTLIPSALAPRPSARALPPSLSCHIDQTIGRSQSPARSRWSPSSHLTTRQLPTRSPFFPSSYSPLLVLCMHSGRDRFFSPFI